MSAPPEPHTEEDLGALAAELLDWTRFAAGAGLVGGTASPPQPRSSATSEDRPSSCRAVPPLPRDEATPRSPDGDSLAQVTTEVSACQACRLAEKRRNAVPGEGAPRAALMVVGEGPGAREDEQGRPFVGEAGEMLTKMLRNVLGLAREEVFIANIVKCRPPENRDPLPDEVAACRPYLERQISLIRPRIILCLGRVAAQNLLATTTPISRLRGKPTVRFGVEIHPTFHPAYLLRNPADKPLVWEDLKRLGERLKELQGSQP